MYISGQYDIVFMDMEMPVTGDCEATRMIRNWVAENHARQIPIVALTAHLSEESRKECLDAGCTVHMIKPIRKEQVLEVLSEYGRYLNL